MGCVDGFIILNISNNHMVK